MVLTLKAVSLLAPFGREPSNAAWGAGQHEEGDASCQQSCRRPPCSGAGVASHGGAAAGAARAALAAPAWRGSSLVSPQLSVTAQQPPALSCAGRQCPGWGSSALSCVELHYHCSRGKRLWNIFSLGSLWRCCGCSQQRRNWSEQQYFQGYPKEEGAVGRAVFKQPHVCGADLSPLSLWAIRHGSSRSPSAPAVLLFKLLTRTEIYFPLPTTSFFKLSCQVNFLGCFFLTVWPKLLWYYWRSPQMRFHWIPISNCAGRRRQQAGKEEKRKCGIGGALFTGFLSICSS